MNLPVLSSEGNLAVYLQEIKKFPMLTAEEEYMLAKRYKEHGDSDAAHKLVTSHLRLVAKIAMGYRGYGLPVTDLISEGNVGIMQAVKRFDPEKGFRLATYAMWWIRAQIQEYVLHSWSLVKIGTTAAQKKLFFNDTATTEIYTLSLHDALPISNMYSSSAVSIGNFLISCKYTAKFPSLDSTGKFIIRLYHK